MAEEPRDLKLLRLLMHLFGILNVVLALNFYPIVPLLGWLNFGHAGWATAWIPDVVLLVVLPAGYFIYWHFWFVVAGLALACSVYLSRRSGSRETRIWAVANGATILMYVVLRLCFALRGIRPDIV
jgi:hypothetical protein